MPDRLHQVPTPQGTLQYRRAGAAATPTHVLLHGIGSASGSWLPLLERLQADPAWGALAWDAPGYGASTPLPMARPRAEDYGRAVWAWLDALSLRTPVVLVGHSLGALMAAAAAALAPERVRAVRLLSPARGYADVPEAEREAVRRQRLANLAQLGPAGMAAARADAMLSAQATPAQRAAVRQTMAAIDPAGYTQAVHLLADSSLQALMARWPAALREGARVASGEADGVTPPAACDAVATALGQTRVSLGPVGHACAVEAPAAVQAFLHDTGARA